MQCVGISSLWLSLSSPSSHLKAKSHSPDSGLRPCALTHRATAKWRCARVRLRTKFSFDLFRNRKTQNSTLVSVQQLIELVCAEGRERERKQGVNWCARDFRVWTWCSRGLQSGRKSFLFVLALISCYVLRFIILVSGEPPFVHFFTEFYKFTTWCTDTHLPLKRPNVDWTVVFRPLLCFLSCVNIKYGTSRDSALAVALCLVRVFLSRLVLNAFFFLISSSFI